MGHTRNPFWQLTAPIAGRLRIGCSLAAVSAAAGIIPFVAVAEVARHLLHDAPETVAVWMWIAVSVVALLVRLASNLAMGAITNIADLKLRAQLMKDVSVHLSKVPLAWFDRHSTADIRKRINDDVAALHHSVAHGLTDVVSACVAPLCALAYLFYCNVTLGMLAVVILLVGIALYACQFRDFKPQMMHYQESRAKLDAATIEYAQGIADIKSYTYQIAGRRAFQHEATGFVRQFWQWISRMSAVAALTEIALSPFFGVLVILVAGLGLMMQGVVNPIVVVPFVLLIPALTAPFTALTFAQHDMMQSREAAGRVQALLQIPILPPANGTALPGSAIVRFEGVTVNRGAKPVLDNVDLVLTPGTVTALLGVSGAGKTSLVKLLARFDDPTRGRITIGGVDLRDIPSVQLAQKVAFVFQDSPLLHATVRENIALGKPDATDQQIAEAARAAYLHDEIMLLPKGYDTEISDGFGMSGGQEQRICIARLLLSSPDIVILDEPTASLDTFAASRVMQALCNLTMDRTVLIVSHDLQAIAHADQICLLDRGQIVERGNHAALMAQAGLYASLSKLSQQVMTLGRTA